MLLQWIVDKIEQAAASRAPDVARAIGSRVANMWADSRRASPATVAHLGKTNHYGEYNKIRNYRQEQLLGTDMFANTFANQGNYLQMHRTYWPSRTGPLAHLTIWVSTAGHGAVSANAAVPALMIVHTAVDEPAQPNPPTTNEGRSQSEFI